MPKVRKERPLEEMEMARWLCLIEANNIIADKMDEYGVDELNWDTAQKHDRAIRGIIRYIKERQEAMLADLRADNCDRFGYLL